MKVGVIGAGSWGTALAQTFAKKGHVVGLWTRDPDFLKELQLNRENKRYHPGVKLSENIRTQENIETLIVESEIIILAVPSYTIRNILPFILENISKECILVSTAKGIENETWNLVSETIKEILGPKFFQNQYAVLSGPSFAKDVMANSPTAVTIAAHSMSTARCVQEALHTQKFQLFASKDVVGVEIAGALKNVIAIAAGASDGLGFGSSARSALITRGFSEIIQIGCAKGADPITFSGLSGLGDLILTCTTDLSRNRRVGLLLAQGKSLKVTIKEIGQVAEGIRTARSARNLAQSLKINTPILLNMYQTLHEGKSAHDVIEDLLNQEPCMEF